MLLIPIIVIQTVFQIRPPTDAAMQWKYLFQGYGPFEFELTDSDCIWSIDKIHHSCQPEQFVDARFEMHQFRLRRYDL
jgi:hypothetical protein